MNNFYKGITFAEGYNKPFAEFKEEFGSTHIFNEMPPVIREQELKKAHKIAINGNASRTIKQVEETTTNEVE